MENENFCPICEQIIQTTQERTEIKISPSRTIRVHDGCANRVKESLEQKNKHPKIKRLG